MRNFVGTCIPQLIFLLFSFVSYVFVNIADIYANYKNLASYNLVNIPSLGINLVQILEILGNCQPRYEQFLGKPP